MAGDLRQHSSAPVLVPDWRGAKVFEAGIYGRTLSPLAIDTAGKP
jgi:hypothetical protein